jgi:hypothetical protein
MNQPRKQGNDQLDARPILDEADIGSGEKTPAQHETDALIREIPPLPPSGKPDQESGAPPAKPRPG